MEIACPECGKPTPRPADILALKTDCVHCGRSIALDALPTMAPASAKSPVSDKSLEGQRLAGYRLVRLIGRGGMGEVYEAVQESLNRKVAVKVLPQRLAADEAFIKRFNRESGALAQLSHPNIVTIYDRGHEGEHYYFVLELVPGKDGGPADTLHRRLRNETPLALTECARLIQQIVGALAYAHGQGVIHRDIKPSNVLLDARDNARLVDFGLARMAERKGAEDFNLTLTGEVLGTAGYVAPEQREGNKQVDARVDIYSCGVLLYEMLTGRLPEGAFELPGELVDGLDPAWDGVVEKALQRNPDRRYQTAGEFLDAIRAAAAGQSTLHPVERPRRAPAQPARRSDTTSSRLTPIVGKCVKCQTINPGDNRYCTECGANLYEECLACKAENRVGTKYCGKCGVDVVREKQLQQLRQQSGTLVEIGHFAEALECLAGGLERFPDDQQLLRLQAQAKSSQMEQELEKFRQQSGQLVEIGHFEEALECLVGGLKRFPHDQRLLQLREQAKSSVTKLYLAKQQIPELCRERKFAAVLQRLDELIQLRADAEGAAQTRERATLAILEAQDLAQRGDQLLTARKPGQALAEFNKALEVCADFKPAVAGVRHAERAAQIRRRIQVAGVVVAVVAVGIIMTLIAFKIRDTRAWEQTRQAVNAAGKNEARVEQLYRDYLNRHPKGLGVLAAQRALTQIEEGRMTEEERQRRARIAELLATAKANDSRTNAHKALAALEELFKLDPLHADALKLRTKYLHPSVNAAWENSLGMKFVPVAGAGVLFGVWDVRVQDYRAYARGNSGVDAAWEKPGFTQGENHPVVNVSWNDAKAFCAWLTAKERREGKISASQSYRLPTDAEWSVAVGLNEARDGTPKEKDGKIKDVYPWGTQWPPPSGAGNYDKSLGVDNYDNTSPVGSFRPNQFGLYDMGGNVWQWCENLYGSDQSSRGLRGASWRFNYFPDYLLSSYRFDCAPDYRLNYIGFRCVLMSDSSR